MQSSFFLLRHGLNGIDRAVDENDNEQKLKDENDIETGLKKLRPSRPTVQVSIGVSSSKKKKKKRIPKAIQTTSKNIQLSDNLFSTKSKFFGAYPADAPPIEVNKIIFKFKRFLYLHYSCSMVYTFEGMRKC